MRLHPYGSDSCPVTSNNHPILVRLSVYDNIDEYRSIVEDPVFRQYFPVVGETFLKTNPKGFPKDFPFPQYIRCKDFTISYRIEDSFYDDPDYLEKIAAAFFQLKRFADFVNYTVDDME